MASLKQHQLDGTYYTVLNLGGYVTKQIHPDGVAFLKRNGVQLFGEIPSRLMSELDGNNWLFTKEEMHSWGEIDWSPHWHLIDTPKPKPFPKENPFKTKKREAQRAAKLAAEEEKRRAAEEAERQKLEEKRATNRERGRRYRARKKAEAEETQRKAEAKRERDRRYRAKKRAEAEAAQEGASAVASPPDPHDDIDTMSKSLPANPAVAPAADSGERRDSMRTPHDSLTQPAPRQKLIQPERLATLSVGPAQEPKHRTPRLIALLVIGFILLVIAIGQVLDMLPI